MERYSEYKDSGVKWLGEIPSHWEPSRNKAIFRETKAVVGKNSKKFTLLSLTKKGVIVRNLDDGGKFPAEFDTYKIVEPGDFIFCFFDVDETPRAIGLATNKGMITGAYTVLKQNTAHSRYLYYYYLSIDNAKALKPLYSGLRKTVPLTSFMSMQIFLPPREEQDAIVSYLDAATSKIDKAIAMQQKMIDLLNERKQIIIQNAVTKGLDENVEMKDSGVEWIGMIPKHWKVRRGKFLFRVVNEYSTTGQEELLTVSDRTGITPRSMKNVNMFMSESLIGYKKCQKGDICSNIMWMWHGAVGVTEYNGVISPSYGVYRQIAFSYDNKYLDYMLRLPRLVEVYGNCSTGLTESRLRLYPDDFMNLHFFVPPLEEQKCIVLQIQKQIIAIEKSIENAEKLIALLQERKQIIINEVVTGKVKVL